jgi:transcriptional regulator with XRE-family HTH domain
MSMATANESRLGLYLKDRRTKLDPAALGFPMKRRRTPGLRREEVAQRAHVSATWYTWLEQGRGGAPSADVLDRIAHALLLTDVEREHLFLLGLGRPPEARFQATEGISPRIQRILDALEFIPAFIKTSTWDIIAWNRAGAAVFGYDTLAPSQRNILRRIFCDPAARAAQLHWESVARFAVAAFRADVVRAGAEETISSLVNELCRCSPEFEKMWRDNDVRGYGEGTKKLRHPKAGILSLEYSAFAVDGRLDLSLVIYNPATPEDAAKIRRLIKPPAGSRNAAPKKIRRLVRI